MWHACGLASLLEQKTKEVRDFLFLRRGWKLLREIEGKTREEAGNRQGGGGRWDRIM